VVYLFPAFQVGLKKKQADACILPDQSDYPSIVLEVGDSECLGQLKIDAKLWIEHVPEVCQSYHLLPPTSWNFFRFSWSSLFSLTLPLPQMQIHESPFNYGGDFSLFILDARQQLSKEKPAWSGQLTGLRLQRRCTFYFLTSLEAQRLSIMVTILK